MIWPELDYNAAIVDYNAATADYLYYVNWLEALKAEVVHLEKEEEEKRRKQQQLNLAIM